MKTRLSLALVVCVTFLTLSLVLPGTASTSTPASTTADSTPSGFRVLGQIALLNSTAVAVQGHYVYVGTSDLHFIVVNVADPTHPAVVNDLTLGVPVSGDDRVFSSVRDIAFLGQSAYLVWGYGPAPWNGLQYGGIIRVDISNPARPVQRDSGYSPTNALSAISIQNGFAYVCRPGGYADLEPMQIQGLTQIVGVVCNDLIFANNLAYTVAGGCDKYDHCSGSMSVIDFTDPVQGHQIGYHDFGLYNLAPANSIEKKDQYVYVVGGHGSAIPQGLQILDVSAPTTPTVVSTAYLPSDGGTENGDVKLWVNNYLITGGSRGLRAFDITNPAYPLPVGFQVTSSWYYMRVATDAQHIYAIYNFYFIEGSLQILDFVPPSITGRVSDLNGSPVPDVTLTLNTGLTATTNLSGSYSLTPLHWIPFTVTPTLPGYAFLPPTQTVTLPPAAEAVNFVRLAQPTWITVTVGSQVTLTYTDTQGLPTTLVFPSTAFSQTTTIALTPTIANPPPHLGFALHAFDLAAYQSGVPVNDWAFQAPVTVTIHYSADDLHIIRDEGTLALWRWDGQMWSDAAETCEPVSSYQREPDQNLLSLPICRAGYYALFGPTNSVLLPIISIFRSPLQPF